MPKLIRLIDPNEYLYTTVMSRIKGNPLMTSCDGGVYQVLAFVPHLMSVLAIRVS